MNVLLTQFARIACTALLFVAADAADAALTQSPADTSVEYAKAIRATLQQAWESASYSETLKPGSTCAVRLTQVPGGYVRSVDFSPDCEFGTADRAAIDEVVRRSEPLPFNGYQGSFQREIRMVFQAASVADREALQAAKAKERVTREESAAEDRRWDATAGLQKLRDEYVGECRFHLLWDSPRIELEHPVRVTIIVDKAGRVVNIVDKKGKRARDDVIKNFIATEPCAPPPAKLLSGDGTVKLDPALVGVRLKPMK
jgi:hypothetical protein